MAEVRWSFERKGDSVWVTHILSTEVCINTQGGVETRSTIDLVLVKRDML